MRLEMVRLSMYRWNSRPGTVGVWLMWQELLLGRLLCNQDVRDLDEDDRSWPEHDFQILA